TLFPYTTLFRSRRRQEGRLQKSDRERERERERETERMRQRAKHRHTDTHTHTHTQVNLGMDHAEGLTQTSMRGNKLGLQFVIPFLYLCLATWTRWRRCSP